MARIGFSFVTERTTLWDVEPQKNAPRLFNLNMLLDEVQDHLEPCRRQWWRIQGTTCLDGRWVEVATPGVSRTTLLPKKMPGAIQIASARYDVAAQELFLRFRGGSTLRIAAGSGDER